MHMLTMMITNLAENPLRVNSKLKKVEIAEKEHFAPAIALDGFL